MVIIITGAATADTVDTEWRWEWDCWATAWAVISAADRLMDILLRVTRLATVMRLLMVMRRPSRHPLFMFSDRMS